jgi:hypothetical protein
MTIEPDPVPALQRDFDRAELTADRDRLEELLADDFRSIGPKGFVLDKAAWIGRHAEFTYQALEVSEVEVDRYEGAVIVRNLQHNRATYRDEPVDLRVRVSQTWVRQDGAWRLAGIQFSPLPG